MKNIAGKCHRVANKVPERGMPEKSSPENHESSAIKNMRTERKNCMNRKNSSTQGGLAVYKMPVRDLKKFTRKQPVAGNNRYARGILVRDFELSVDISGKSKLFCIFSEVISVNRVRGCEEKFNFFSSLPLVTGDKTSEGIMQKQGATRASRGE